MAFCMFLLFPFNLLFTHYVEAGLYFFEATAREKTCISYNIIIRSAMVVIFLNGKILSRVLKDTYHIIYIFLYAQQHGEMWTVTTTTIIMT